MKEMISGVLHRQNTGIFIECEVQTENFTLPKHLRGISSLGRQAILSKSFWLPLSVGIYSKKKKGANYFLL